MQYIGIEPNKPKIGVFDFTACEGCELEMINNEGSLIDFLNLVEVVNFREISSDALDNYDIAFIEGSISRKDDAERLKKIRAKAKVLVAIGACATFGGVNFRKNKFSLDKIKKDIYGDKEIDTMEVHRVADIVKVDLNIYGCPPSKKEIEQIIVDIVTGADIRSNPNPVCYECQQNMNICVFELGEICLGPITRCGCNSICTNSRTACLGCRGPADDPNIDMMKRIMKKHGFTTAQIREKMEFFNGFSGVKI